MNDDTFTFSRIVRPDGMSSDSEETIIKLNEIDFPFPSDKPTDIADLCMQRAQTPQGVRSVLAMFPQDLLVILEMHYALKARDERIDELEERIAELEDLLDEDEDEDEDDEDDGDEDDGDEDDDE